jgi:arylsulfatase A
MHQIGDKMNISNIHRFTGGIMLLFLIVAPGCRQMVNKELSGSKPNIVFILADDMGWSDLPVYGNRFNEAPQLTRMAEQGIRFTDAYAACPVCSPTRASIMSGQYPARVGIIDFITGHWRPYEEVIVPSNRTQFLPLEIQTIGEILRQAGYRTGYFGKWHLGNGQYYPQNQGFEEVNVYQGGGYFGFAPRMSNALQVDPGTSLAEALTDLSVNFIEEHKEEPFFLFLAHYDVHVQLDARQTLIDKYLAREKVDGYPCNAIYAAMVEEVDQSTGRILQRLEELGLSERTLVIFFSDNGGLISRFDRVPLIDDSKKAVYAHDTLQYIASSNAPLRAEKGTLYEGGIREPLIMWWPGTLEAGRISHSIVSSVDFLPTLADLTGMGLPEGQVADGTSLVPLMEGGELEPDRAIYWHYPVYHHDTPASAIRAGKWKLIHHLVDDRIALYDLEADIGEQRDLSGIEPEKAATLYQMLEAWRKACGAEFPVPNPDFDPARRDQWGIHPDRR